MPQNVYSAKSSTFRVLLTMGNCGYCLFIRGALYWSLDIIPAILAKRYYDGVKCGDIGSGAGNQDEI